MAEVRLTVRQVRSAMKGFTAKRRMKFFYALARLVEQRMALDSAFDLLYENFSDEGRRPRAPEAVLAIALRKTLDGGGGLAEGLEGWAPPEQLMILSIATGEENMARALRVCVRLERLSIEMRSLLIGSVRYPAFTFLMIVALCFFYSIEVIPSYESMYPIERWTGIASLLPGFLHFVTAGPGGVVLVVLVGLGWFLAYLLPRWSSAGRAAVEGMFPFSTYRMYHGVHFMVSMASLLRLGAGTDPALLQLAQYSQPWLRSKLMAVRREVLAGHTIADSLWRADPNFPDRRMNRELRTLAQASGFERELEEFAFSWMESARDSMALVAGGVEKVAPVANGLIFGFVLVCMLSLGQQVSFD